MISNHTNIRRAATVEELEAEYLVAFHPDQPDAYDPARAEAMDIAARMSAGCGWTEYSELEARLSELLAIIECVEA